MNTSPDYYILINIGLSLIIFIFIIAFGYFHTNNITSKSREEYFKKLIFNVLLKTLLVLFVSIPYIVLAVATSAIFLYFTPYFSNMN